MVTREILPLQGPVSSVLDSPH